MSVNIDTKPRLVPKKKRVFTPLLWNYVEIPDDDPFADLAAWSHDVVYYDTKMTRNIHVALDMMVIDPLARQLIVWDAYSGYSECHVLDALMREGRLPCLERVMFCDIIYAHLDEMCLDIPGNYRSNPRGRELDDFANVWRRMCAAHRVHVSVCKSAWELVHSLDDVPSEIIMINALHVDDRSVDHSISKGAHSLDREKECDAMSKLWKWCDAHISHGPQRLVHGDFHTSGSWLDWAVRG